MAMARTAGLRHGIERSGNVGPKSATIGVWVVEAMCNGPLFPPTDLGLLEMPDRDLLQIP